MVAQGISNGAKPPRGLEPPALARPAARFAREYWIVCAGQLLPISRNTMLFALLGNAFGGDGRTTFAVPNLEGAFPIHPGKPEERGQASGVSAEDGSKRPLLVLQYCLAMKGIFPPRSS
jgi:microcystin-dependent protein